MGTQILAAATAAKSTSSSSSSLLLIVLVFAVLMIFMFRSQRRRQRQAQNTQSQVMNGTRIRTVHGIYGTVVDSDDRNVMVEIAPGVKIKMLRQAIGTVDAGLRGARAGRHERLVGQRRRSQRPAPLAAPLLTERKTRHSWLPQAPPTPGQGGTSQHC
jgi:preprotein translocase subunit YajC